ncbi:unnamed protein product [Calicophoron daubneyi]|uniref:Large ribosomal subunit protein mL49 n=1 Tax=Calicophoron daubneyi TaxID=300641 RepID=A0AAV2TVD6_CALDB
MFAWSRTSTVSLLPLRLKHTLNVRWWPTLDNPWAEITETVKSSSDKLESPKIPYEISKEDFKWVECLIRQPKIPPPPKDATFPTPSGWVPPNPDIAKQYSYFVRRSRNHMLPVYFEERQRKDREQAHGQRQLTVIKHVDGDMWALVNDLRTLLEPKCDGGLFLCQVDEATRKIRIEGIFLEEVAQFLLDHGF